MTERSLHPFSEFSVIFYCAYFKSSFYNNIKTFKPLNLKPVLRVSAKVGYALFLLGEDCLFAFNIGLSDTAVMDMMVSTLQQQRAVTEQLRREAAIKRIAVSAAVQDIIDYINEHEQEDCLLVGFSSQRVNPFREKSSCSVL